MHIGQLPCTFSRMRLNSSSFTIFILSLFSIFLLANLCLLGLLLLGLCPNWRTDCQSKAAYVRAELVLIGAAEESVLDPGRWAQLGFQSETPEWPVTHPAVEALVCNTLFYATTVYTVQYN